jgi:hypothetical protein
MPRMAGTVVEGRVVGKDEGLPLGTVVGNLVGLVVGIVVGLRVATSQQQVVESMYLINQSDNFISA